MILAHVAGVPVEESLAYLLPIVLVVGFIYWSGFRERRRAERGDPDNDGDTPATEDGPTPTAPVARGLQRLR